MSDDIFRQSFANFAKNFAYGDAVRHLYRRGYSTKRIQQDYDYPYTFEELEKIRLSVEREQSK